MELYVIAGGQLDSINRWQQDLNSVFLPIYKNGKKVKYNEGLTHRRLLVAPIQMFKICFPEEELDNVISMVCPTDYIEKRYGVIRNFVKVIRKVLGLKKAPKPNFINPFFQPNQVDKAVFVIPIGLKKDKFNKDGYELI